MTESTSEQLFSQFHQCAHLLHRRRGRFHDRSGMARHAQGRLLALLSRMDGASQKELADILGIRPPSLSELVIKLERAGYVTRQPNEQDRRLMDIAITPEGRESIESMGRERAEAAKALFAGLGPEEQEQLSALLAKLIAALEEEDRAAGEDEPGELHGPDPEHCHQRGHGPHGLGSHDGGPGRPEQGPGRRGRGGPGRPGGRHGA